MRIARISRNIAEDDAPGPGMMDVILSDEGRLAQIELLAYLAALLLLFLEVSGAFRRRCSNGMFRLTLWTAYTIPITLINYTIGLMNGSKHYHGAFGAWMVFLIFLATRADSFSAHNLGDNEQWKRYNWQLLVIIATGLIVLVLFFYIDASASTIAIVILYFAVVMKTFVLAQSSMLATKAALQKKGKLVAEYTMREHLGNNQDEVDLTTMKGYTYLVRSEEEEREHRTLAQRLYVTRCCKRKKVVKAKAPEYHVPIKLGPRVITIEKIWQCQGKLLKTRDSDHRIKDFCLSFALFRILSLKFVDYSMPQEVYHKSWELFQKIINSSNGDCERAFRIIEVELTFVFFQFYTKYPYFFQPHHWMLKLGELVLVSISSCLVASYFLEVEKEWDSELDLGSLVLATMIIVYLILEILQFVFMFFSEWGKVVLICNYVMRESWQKCKCIEKLVEFICHIELLKPWERKLHQYSLLESYGYNPSLLLYNNLTAALIDQQKEGREQGTPVELSTEVKSAVISSLMNMNMDTKLQNGKTSLIRNDMLEGEYFWACDLETQAQVIMVWHIATSMCESEFPENKQPDIQKNFKIATNLSKYLAYLVAFAPRMLPDHPYVAEYMFDQVIIEARETFKECTSLEDRIKELKDNHSREGGETVINRGARLGKQLLNVKEPKIVWQVLADFWAELMLYVAPSEDVEAHVEKLTMGGEFVTQIWLLLLHSGIMRDPPRKTPVLERSQSCLRA